MLHDLFDLPFEEASIAGLDREAAARQLAGHARRRARGGHEGREDEAKKRESVSACSWPPPAKAISNALLLSPDPEILLTADACGRRGRLGSLGLKGAAPPERDAQGERGGRKPSSGWPWPPSSSSSMAPGEPPGSAVENPGWLSCSALEMAGAQAIDVVMDLDDLLEMEVEPVPCSGVSHELAAKTVATRTE